MSYAAKAIYLGFVLVLLGAGVWSNLTKGSFPEARGMWVTHATRGMGGY
jgi:hypothetical protein